MNLEQIEEKCLNYLRQTSNPLVPVDTLLEFCKRDSDADKLGRKDLLTFLRAHEQIQIMDGPAAGDVIDQDDFAAVGLSMGQRAILKSRVPTKEELAEMLFEQLKDMTEVLVEALKQAKKTKDNSRVSQLEAALKKSEVLRGKMNQML